MKGYKNQVKNYKHSIQRFNKLKKESLSSNIFKLMPLPRIKKKPQASYSGSITVEATFVMPIVLIVIFALLYLSFYLQDRNKIQAAIDLSLFQASTALKHPAELVTGRTNYDEIRSRGVFYSLYDTSDNKEEAIGKLITLYLSKELYLLKDIEVEVKVKQNEMVTDITGKGEIPIPILRELIQPFCNFTLSEENTIHDPAEAIRCMEVILDTGSKIKGVSELKKLLQDMAE